jgi:Primase X
MLVLPNNNHELTAIVESGLDFILSHFPYLSFPRTISTFESQNKQIMVRSKEETLRRYEESNYIDCRINAFPSLKEGISWAPDFIFMDLDLTDFKSKRALDLALNKTLKNINERLNAHPTVLETGGGYHIYQPITGIEFEHYRDFNEFSDLNLFNEFLRFSKKFLSNGKADKQNNPSLKSCLLRIPNTINSKHQTKVSIIQKWDGCRPHIRLLIGDFHAYLIDKRDIELRNKLHSRNNIQTNANIIPWIEKLLETPIEDGRKYTIWKILCPYLVNIKNLDYDESYKILKLWLEKCNKLRELDFNSEKEIRTKLRYVKNFNPISIKALAIDNKYFYILLTQKMNIK